MKKILFVLLIIFAGNAFSQSLKTENIILITLDGMRWQEVFNGGDSSFMRQQKYLKDAKIKEKFWRVISTTGERHCFLFSGIHWQLKASSMEIVSWDAK